MDWFLPFLKNILVSLAALGEWLTSPIVNIPNLPQWLTSPIALFSIAGFTFILFMNIISLLNPTN